MTPTMVHKCITLRGMPRLAVLTGWFRVPAGSTTLDIELDGNFYEFTSAKRFDQMGAEIYDYSGPPITTAG